VETRNRPRSGQARSSHELLTQGVAEGDARSESIKLAVRKIVEEALEARSPRRWAAGQLAVEMYARGLSTRDIEAAFRDASGASVLSRNRRQPGDRAAVAGVRSVRRPRPQVSSPSPTSSSTASPRTPTPGLPREAVLCAWGITEDGRKVSCTWRRARRRTRPAARPSSRISNAAAWPIRWSPSRRRAGPDCARRDVLPRALRQRCLVHRMRNLRSKAPESQWRRSRCGPAGATRRRRRRSPPSCATTSSRRTSATCRPSCNAFRDDFDACIAHLRFPLRHRRVVRTTNLLERLLLEERRRTKIIPHAFGERPVLKLMYAASSARPTGGTAFTVGEFEQRQLRRSARSSTVPTPSARGPPCATSRAASPSKLSSKAGLDRRMPWAIA